MDLWKLQKGAYLVPTPGKLEQEYLAGYLDGKFGFKMVKELESRSTWNKNLILFE